MIAETEIRIGNVFSHNGEWNWATHQGHFAWSSGDWNALGECSIDLENVSPVPLTLELLDRCGFERYDANLWGHPRESEYSLYLRSGDIFTFGHDQLHPHYYTAVQYLHELQNLFFALTGEELTIKPVED